MIGWSITITWTTPEEYQRSLGPVAVLADWKVGAMGTSWIDELVARDEAPRVQSGGYLRLTRRDVMLLDPGVLAPGKDGVTGQLGAIIADDHARQPATFEGRIADPVLAAQVGGLHARLMLAQHANDLILGKSASPHHSFPSDELTYQWHDFWGAGQRK